ncbi:MAG: hypothetical protein JWN72_1803 [Thermoleophilia bacterium]|nr:hypothetical protein [Thermoleophilia bacterium]
MALATNTSTLHSTFGDGTPAHGTTVPAIGDWRELIDEPGSREYAGNTRNLNGAPSKQEIEYTKDVLLPPPDRTLPSTGTFLARQEWEGVVVEVREDSFVARLVDARGSGPDEEAEILIDEVSSFDLPLMIPGSIFYWGIGYREENSGQRTRASILRFRRLPSWSKRDIARIEARSAELAEYFLD